MFILALIIALFSIGAVSAGFFDFLHFGGSSDVDVVEDGEYCTVDEVAAYIKEYHKLPSNYITKKEAQSLGWHGLYARNVYRNHRFGDLHFRAVLVHQGKQVYLEIVPAAEKGLIRGNIG
jgi:hypothetical protein